MGQLLITNAGRLITAQPGGFTLSGPLTNLARSGLLQADQGSFALTGENATMTNSAGGSGPQFVFVQGASWAGAPASYNTSLATAVSLLQTAFPHVNATFYIEIGYGFWDETDLSTASPVSASSSEGSHLYGSTQTYTNLRAAMAAIPSPPSALSSLLTNTPAGSSLNSTSNAFVPSAVCKVLGLFGGTGPASATDTRRDGAIGMGSGWATGKLVGVWLHELTHAMGRETVWPCSFSRFTSVGVRDFTTGSNNGAYFSLDGGTTKLADYDNANDFSDFLNAPDGTGVQDQLDNFNAFQASGAYQTLTTLDIQLMNAIGFV